MFDIIFNHPQYLWFLIALPLIILTHFLVLMFIKRKALRFANFETMKRVVEVNAKGIKKPQTLSKNLGLLLIRLLVLFILVLVLSDIVIKYQAYVSNNDYIIAIDNSGSMLANDYYPNRLTAAKDAAVEFVNQISSNAKIGVLAFSGYPIIIQNPTTDYEKVKAAINSINVSSESGTDIASAIIMSTYLLKEKNIQGDVILLTDGQTNIGAPIAQALKIAIDNNVRVYTIGIGTKKGGTFMKGGLSKLDESLLQHIARVTNAKYFESKNINDLKKSFSEINKSKKEIVSKDISLYLLFLAFVLIFIEWGLINTRYRTLP